MIEKIAVIGGLGTLSGGDLFFKLLKNKNVLKNQQKYHFIFEQQPFSQINLPLHQEEDIKSRKFYTYKVCKNFETQGVTKVMLPCFASHFFIDELQKEISIPIINIYESLYNYITSKIPAGAKLGVVTSDFVINKGFLNKIFPAYELVYPSNQAGIMEAIYGAYGIKNGHLDGLPIEIITESCIELCDMKCDIILPCITELSLIVEQLWRRGIPVLDVNQIYADFALEQNHIKEDKRFKLGILGGVGPAATVDFMNKIIQNTPAERDQDHIKMVVEQNPQIPDRTANLIRQETDPTIAMFATCKQLEAEGADAIAIPCNTAHAFVEDIQEHLNIPIINMLTITAEHIVMEYGTAVNVGLLATDGTIQSKVYSDILEKFNLNVVLPKKEYQKYVMQSIYGADGVKAGFIEGESKNNILKAAYHLIESGADVLILGCKELPLLFAEDQAIIMEDKHIHLIDPTLILAKKIIALVND